MALDHSRLGLENKFLENKSGRIFCVRQVYLPTNLGACKPTFYTFYTSHLRWNSTMRRCFYHTDLGQNAVFHNFAIQISLIKYSGRWKHAWAFSEIVKKNSKSPIRPAGSHFWQPPNEWTITELHFNIIKNLLCLFFIWWFYKRSVIFKSVWYGRHFKYSCKRCSWTTENKRHKD